MVTIAAVAIVQQMLGPCAVFVLSNNIIANCIGLSRIGCLGQRVRIGLIKDKLFEDLGITGRIVRIDQVNNGNIVVLRRAANLAPGVLTYANTLWVILVFGNLGLIAVGEGLRYFYKSILITYK